MRLAALTAGLVLMAGAAHAEPNGLMVWTGKGIASERGGDPERFGHLSAMHFPNGRTAYTTMGPGPTFAFGGSPPIHHGRTYVMHVDQVHIGSDAYDADGACQIKLRADGRTVQSVGCAAHSTGDRSPSMHFDAARTPADFTSFDKR